MSGAGETAVEALRRLEQRLEQASRAAESVLAEAAGRAESPASEGEPRPADVGGIPRSGWQTPGASEESGSGGELELVLKLFGSLRELIPAELQQRLADAFRELLLALRAVIDFYLERAERRAQAEAAVEEIPIL